jgi:hypothetical protein
LKGKGCLLVDYFLFGLFSIFHFLKTHLQLLQSIDIVRIDKMVSNQVHENKKPAYGRLFCLTGKLTDMS